MPTPGKEEARLPYRADIDGLRAVAVLAVVAYHYFGGLFSGGFIGVDIFFVISGYLLGAIVVKESQEGRFSFRRFYERRIRRIFPALFFLLAVCTVLAWLVLLPQDAVDYGRSMLAATLSASNFYFWTVSNYFDAPAADKPLLHTWSLAVEEQFYLLFPVFIFLIYRWRPRYLRFALGLAATASFLWSVVDLRLDPTAAFYLPFTRTWELLAGAMLALRIVPAPRSRVWLEALSISGLAGIVWLVFSLSPSVPFPGATSLLPCAAAGAVILSGQNASTMASRLLSSKPIVFVGLISYSLYLWHWPLLVLGNVAVVPASFALPPIALRLVLAGLAFLIAVISWRWVETPFRSGPRRPGQRAIYLFAAACIVLVSTASLLLVVHGGFPGRFSPDVDAVAGFLDYGKTHPNEAAQLFREGSCFLNRREPVDDFDERLCMGPAHAKRQVLLFGDSHAANLQFGLEKAFPNFHFNQAASSACPPLLEEDAATAAECRQFAARVLEVYIPKYSVQQVVLSAEWHEQDLASLTRTIAFLREKGIAVVILGPLPRYESALPRLLATSIVRRDRDFAQIHRDPSVQSIDAAMARMAAGTWRVPYVSLFSILCPENRCVEYARPGIPLEFDASHLTLPGSEYVGRELSRNLPGLFDAPSADRSGF